MAVNGLEMRRRLIASQPHPETVSGAVASFVGERFPLKSCKTFIDPVQDLHGYDSPWPAGGGKNLYDASTFPTTTKSGITCANNGDGSFTLNGTASNNVFFDIFAFQFRESKGGTPLPNGAYRITGCPAGGSTSTYYMYITPSYSSDTGGGNTNNNTTVTGGSIFIKNGYTCNNLVFRPMIRMASNGDDTFAPYSNICPITGWIGAKVTRTGKNVCDVSNVTRRAYNIGSIPNTLKPNTRYTYSINGTTTSRYRLYLAKSSNPTSAVVALSSAYITAGEYNTFTTPSDMDNYDVLCLAGNSSTAGAVEMSAILPQIELGSTATAYEPYSGQTYDITLPSEAGTVYGGSLDVTTGVLTVDRVKVQMDGTENFAKWSAAGASLETDGVAYAFSSPTNLLPKYEDGFKNAICDILESVSNVEMYYRRKKSGVCVANGNRIAILVEGITDTEAMRSFIVANKPYVCYKLFTPITYTLTPQEVRTLLGQNNIWADTGDVSVTYWKH